MSRIVLAFDTATEHIAIGLAEITPGAFRVLAEADFAAPRAALGRLLPAVHCLMADAGVSGSDITAVAVGRGPGSFTGVRIAVATAKGLAHGFGVPLAGFGTLDAVAWRLAAHEGLVGVVGDAMRGEVYPSAFSCGDGRVERLDEYHVARPTEAAAAWAGLGQPMLLAGNGLQKYRDVFAEVLGPSAVFAEESLWTPTGASAISAALAERVSPSLAGALMNPQGTGMHPGVLLPVYTRLSDAEESERHQAGLTAAVVPPGGVAGAGPGARS
jgi:N6-L-threonylcarbamoyladenine synthase